MNGMWLPENRVKRRNACSNRKLIASHGNLARRDEGNMIKEERAAVIRGKGRAGYIGLRYSD